MPASSAAPRPATPDRPNAPAAPPAIRRLCTLLVVLLLISFFGTGIRGILLGFPDFEYFYKGGAALLERGSLDSGYDVSADGRVEPRGKLDWYLPFVPRLLTVLAWLPAPAAGLLWLAGNVIGSLLIVWLIARHLMDLPRPDWAVVQLVPLAFLFMYWHWEYRLNQVDSLILLLLVGAFVCWQSRRPWAAGLWMGLAVLIKVTPLLVLGWFVLKRQVRVVAAALLTIVLAGPVSDALVFGPRAALNLYSGWVNNAVTNGSHRALILNQTEIDWRNQGSGVLLCRFLHPSNFATRFDNDPRIRYADPPAYMNLANLPLPTVAAVVGAVHLATLLGLVWLARRPASALTPWQCRLEWALFVLAMLWFMPVMRRYHVIWALPAMSMLAASVHFLGPQHRCARLAILAMLAAGASQFAMAYRPLEARGAVLAVVVLLGVPLVALLVRLARNPRLVPAGGAPPAAPVSPGPLPSLAAAPV